MSGVEIALPIISAVAAIISAYRDGGTILNKIKDRRQKRGAHPPTDSLQQAFQRGEKEVAQAQEDIEERFGKDFRPDLRTTRALKDITITLQDSIIKNLSAAQDNDDMDDFSPCLDEAVKARKQTVTLLNQLYVNLEEQQKGETITMDDSERNLLRQTTQTFEDLSLRSSTRAPTFASMASTSPPNPPPQRTRTFSSVMRLGRRQQSVSETPQRAVPISTPNPVSPDPRRSPVRSPRTPLSPNPMSRSSLATSPDVRRTSASLSGYPSPVIVNEPVSISENNDYGGLCKGAWRTQRQEFKKAIEQSIRGYDRSYHCKYCKFNLPADTWNKEPCFDDRMKVSGNVYFRDMFLFKSHIKRKDSSHQYKCAFCILAGDASPTFKSAEHLLEHTLGHRGTWYGPTELEGPCEVTPTAINPTHISDFDICFKVRRRSSVSQFPMLPGAAMQDEPVQRYELDAPPDFNPWA